MVTWDKDRDSCRYLFTSYVHVCSFWNGCQPTAISRFPLHACKTCDAGQFETARRVPRPMHTRTCSTISQWVFLLESTRNTNGSPITLSHWVNGVNMAKLGTFRDDGGLQIVLFVSAMHTISLLVIRNVLSGGILKSVERFSRPNVFVLGSLISSSSM